MRIAIELFLVGLAASFGPCLLYCSPLIVIFIAGTKKGWKEGLVSMLIFSLGRLIAASILGFLVGILGRLLIDKLSKFDYVIFVIGGILISIIGMLMMLGRESPRLCEVLKKHTVDNKFRGPMLLGFIVGILPCLPLLGVLAYIALNTRILWQGAFYGFAFGLGEAISPLIIVGVFAGILPKMVLKDNRIYGLFARICGFIIFLIGLNLAVSSLFRT